MLWDVSLLDAQEVRPSGLRVSVRAPPQLCVPQCMPRATRGW